MQLAGGCGRFLWHGVSPCSGLRAYTIRHPPRGEVKGKMGAEVMASHLHNTDRSGRPHTVAPLDASYLPELGYDRVGEIITETRTPPSSDWLDG